MDIFLENPNLFSTLLVVAIGFIVGKRNELAHYGSIRLREGEFLQKPTVTTSWHENERVQEAKLVSGVVCVSIDHFKRLIAALINFFGGPVVSYESLVDRARREAILRMKESAQDFDIIVNLRVETSTISGNVRAKNFIGSVEAIAYGTAIKYSK